MPTAEQTARRNAAQAKRAQTSAMAEAREVQSREPDGPPSGAILLMKQTPAETRQAQAAASAAVSEVDEMMMVNDPQVSTSNLDRGQGTDERFRSIASNVTSPEARTAKKNYVEVVRPPMRTLYRDSGDSIEVFHSDVPMLVEEGRMHVRCPKCRYLSPTHERANLWAVDRYGNVVPGIHANIGENSCPGVEPLMWLPCRICGKKVYEEAADQIVGVNNADENMFELSEKDKSSPQNRKERCEFRRNVHEVSFHRQSALQRFGLRYANYRGDAPVVSVA